MSWKSLKLPFVSFRNHLAGPLANIRKTLSQELILDGRIEPAVLFMLDRYLAPGYLWEEMRPGNYGDPDHPGWASAPPSARKLFAQASASWSGPGVFDSMLAGVVSGLHSMDLDKKNGAAVAVRDVMAWAVRDVMMLGVRSFAKNKNDPRFSMYFYAAFPDRLGGVLSLLNESRTDTQSVKFASPNCEHWGAGAEVELWSQNVGPGGSVNSRYVYTEGQIGPWGQPAPPAVEFRRISNVWREIGIPRWMSGIPVSIASYPKMDERFSHEELRLYYYFATGKAVPAFVLEKRSAEPAKSVEGTAPSECRSQKYPDPCSPALQFQPQIRAPSLRFGGAISSSFVQPQPPPFGPTALPPVMGSSTSASPIAPAQPQPPASASLVSRDVLSSGERILQTRGQPQEDRSRSARLKEGLEGRAAGRPATSNSKEEWTADIAAVYRVVLPSKVGEVPAIVERNEGRLTQFYIGLLKRNSIPSFDLQTYVVSMSKLTSVWKWNSQTSKYASREGGGVSVGVGCQKVAILGVGSCDRTVWQRVPFLQ